MGLLNLREIGKILSHIDQRALDNLEANLELGKRLRAALFAYLDAHDERARIGATLTAADNYASLGLFDQAAERENATLENLREIIRLLRQGKQDEGSEALH